MIRELYFVELTVADWPAALAWYRDILGLEVLMEASTEGFALLRAGTGRIALKAGQPNPGTTILALEVDNVVTEMQRLAGEGIAIEGPVKTSPEGYRRLLLRDLDGYPLCLFDWQR